MKERPIQFPQPHADQMVRAILDGRKTQMRRQETDPVGFCDDRLWVRETWADVLRMGFDKDLFPTGAAYKADCTCGDSLRCAADYGIKWRPSIHMPRWASRITLEITAVRVERVQDITEEDAMAEGCQEASLDHTEDCHGEHCALAGGPDDCCGYLISAKLRFRDFWQSTYGTWNANPLVWVYEFRRVKP